MSIDVKALRARLGWSQTELAKFLCIADSTVARWESGDRVPSGRTGDDLTSLEHMTTRATPELLQAFKASVARGETVRTLMARAMDQLARVERAYDKKDGGRHGR